MSTSPTEGELSDVKFAIQKLWELDENRLNPGVDYAINLPLVLRKNFNTRKKLFQFVSNKVRKIPTYALFYKLLDNYVPETGIPEEVDTNELGENKAFIKACLKTAPMIYAFNYLKAKNKIQGNLSNFEKQLHKIWFKLYKRENDGDSSAFEHVFVGEVRNGEAMAFHNWITLYFNEIAGKIDYEGCVQNGKNRDEEPDPNSHVISIRFNFEGAKKPFSTSFVGTSPEFELAMYTLLFYLHKQETEVTLDDVDLKIKVFSFGGKFIGSAFPTIVNNHH